MSVSPSSSEETRFWRRREWIFQASNVFFEVVETCFSQEEATHFRGRWDVFFETDDAALRQTRRVFEAEETCFLCLNLWVYWSRRTIRDCSNFFLTTALLQLLLLLWILLQTHELWSIFYVFRSIHELHKDDYYLLFIQYFESFCPSFQYFV